MNDPSFVNDVLSLFDEHEEHDSLYWRKQVDGGFKFFVNVNDVFWWGAADLEEITPGNISVLREAFRDAATTHEHGEIYGDQLFAARVRGLRPQGAMYDHLPADLWSLFDACGPKRDIDVYNPKQHPVDRP